MSALLRRFTFPVLCLLAVPLGAQQAAEPPRYTQQLTYLKTTRGKGEARLQMTRNETMKAEQVRANAGEIVSWTLLRSVYPAGEEARSDYLISVIYAGLPPAPGGNSGLEANLKKAGVNLSANDYWAKRREVVTRVASELWRVRERVAAPAVGHYIQINSMKVNDMTAYTDFESKIWRPIAESWVKDGSMSGWIFSTKMAPTGSETPYQAYSADMYPTWEAVFKSRSMSETFAKVHPGKKLEDASATMGKVRSLARRELWVVVERVEKAK